MAYNAPQTNRPTRVEPRAAERGPLRPPGIEARSVAASGFELLTGEARFRAMIENSPDLLALMSADGTILYGSPALEDALQHRPGEIAGRDLLDFTHPEDAGRLRGAWQRALENPGLIAREECRFGRSDGSWLLVESVARAHWADSGELVVIVSARPVNGRGPGTKGGYEDSDRPLVVEEQTQMIQPDGTLIFANAACRRTFQARGKDLFGKSVFDLMSPEAAETTKAHLAALTPANPVATRQIHDPVTTGDDRWMEWTDRAIYDEDGHLVYYQRAGRDITERKQAERERKLLEQQLYQAQRLESLGTLAGGIAHDFNNLLIGIIGITEVALRQMDQNSEGYQSLRLIPEQGRQAAELIRSLMSFSRPMDSELRPLPLLPLVRDLANILRRILPENISVRMLWPPRLPLVDADPTQIQQVITNLVTNARDAMPEGGELTVALSETRVDEDYWRRADAPPGSYVCLSVRDTGLGIAPEVQARIFEPFFTTKGQTQGTGLGLAMVQRIVKGHGGYVEVASEPGTGTEFKVYLPALAETSPEARIPDAAGPPVGKETLLLVEDDSRVLWVGQCMLESLGYTVLTARDGEEALEVYRGRQPDIALVVSDVAMPKMGGKQLSEAIAQLNPAASVLLASGYTMEPNLSASPGQGRRGFVQKPYDLRRLGEAVRQALDA